MAELTSQQRDDLSDSKFAYIDTKGGRHLPIHDEEHIRNAAARFNQTHFESAKARQQAARQIQVAATKHGVHLDDDDAVIEATR
ncbi:hypothetical protein GCM10008955_19310 [Deinococcus malanensis]|uniref:DUF2188 domain-containing protein n=1 Tax=Deinococcus malanensis TaxID=1706855 RepID=A0ABQ2EUM7_9DEIO|nr:DUF6582 domain-containing protein [Deinococcus malanensis]GGK25713.1 hypothetical protein GCM10008955_19310 [Deinococcus malanensis]